MELIKLIAIYIRVSLLKDEDEKTLDNQLMAIEEFAKEKGYTIVQKYVDDGWSGDDLVRPSLDQLRMDAKKKMWDAVLVYDPDRLARRSAWQEIVIEELKQLSIETLFVTVPPPKNDEDIIMYKMRGVFAEYERMKIRERFRLGKIRKLKSGHILTSEPKYGWNYIPKKKNEDNSVTHGYYEINEDEARVCRMIWNWIDKEDLTLRGVVKRLHELKIRPRKSKKGTWSTSTLSTMLNHEAYIGMTHWGSSYAVIPENPISKEKYRRQKKSSRKKRPKENWYMVEVPAILDKEQFYRVKGKLRNNFLMSRRNRKNQYLLAGKLWCSCGRRRCGNGRQKDKHLYYRCNGRIHDFPLPATCNEGAVNVGVADKLVWQRISSLMSSPELMEKQVERWFKARKTTGLSPASQINDLQKESAKLSDQIERFNKAYGAGLITLEQLKEYTAPLKERYLVVIEQLSAARQTSQQAESMSTPTKAEIKAFARKATDLLFKNLSFDRKREIVLSTIDRVVGTQKELQVYGHIPVTNVIFCSIHRNRRSAERG